MHNQRHGKCQGLCMVHKNKHSAWQGSSNTTRRSGGGSSSLCVPCGGCNACVEGATHDLGVHLLGDRVWG